MAPRDRENIAGPKQIGFDEWLFSVRVNASSQDDAPRLFQLRKGQPQKDDKSSSTLDPEAAAAAADQQIQESVSLLDDQQQQQARKKQPCSTAGGWSFTSPFWNLQVDTLLTVTYAPAWQVLPEYTNHQQWPRCAASYCCCCCREKAIEYMSQTFTTADIIHVKEIEHYHVEGIGACNAIQLYLRAFFTDNHDELPPVPEHLQAAWEKQLEQIRESQRERGVDQEVSKNDDEPDDGPILTFCLPKSHTDPPLLWNVQFPVLSEQPIAIETLTVFDGALVVPRRTQPMPTHIYINGYQSWSFAGSICRGQKQPTSAMPDTFSRAFNHGGSPPPPMADCVYSSIHDLDKHTDNNSNNNYSKPFQVQYQSDFFTCITSDCPHPSDHTTKRSILHHRTHAEQPYQELDETGGPALLLGWLSQRQQFGVITGDADLECFQMHCSAHGQVLAPGVTSRPITTDWAYAQLISPHSYDEEPMVHYLHAVAECNHARPLQIGLLTGWCSWYFAYEQISEQLLRDNFRKLVALRTMVPTNVLVVDDGYMTAWGDWDSVKPREFPQGMQVTSDHISAHSMRPGLWMAPFAADKHSSLVKEHPDYIIRNNVGVPANSSNCGKFFYGLDASNPRVREYVHESVRRAVEDWGFNVLKIDFLYAACLEGNGKYDLSMSRAQAMHLALKTIRDAAGPDTFLIGCGCPIATGIGFVDAMRVSADTGPTWYPAMPLPWWDNGTLPSLRSMVRNSVSRAPMGHRWWHNDPDCLMFGEHTRLTAEEIASAASIVAMTCGMLLLSDDLPKVPASRMRILSKIFPLTGVTAVVLDLHSTNDGLPSLLRLWCTDKYDFLDRLRETMSFESSDNEERDFNAEATFFARHSSFRVGEEPPAPDERQRSCIHVTKGLGTWTVVSISNWTDNADVVHIPPPALLPPPKTGWGADATNDERGEEYGQHGYHVFAFWTSRYSWLPRIDHKGEEGAEHMISKRLGPHETEIFHIKPVTPDIPQYIGSDLHFSCGQEVLSFQPSRNSLELSLKTDLQRIGEIFVFIPRIDTSNIRVTVDGQPGRWKTVGNTPKVNENGSPRLLGRIISIAVVVRKEGDFNIYIDF